jgi:hypothetical protein
VWSRQTRIIKPAPSQHERSSKASPRSGRPPGCPAALTHADMSCHNLPRTASDDDSSILDDERPLDDDVGTWEARHDSPSVAVTADSLLLAGAAVAPPLHLSPQRPHPCPSWMIPLSGSTWSPVFNAHDIYTTTFPPQQQNQPAYPTPCFAPPRCCVLLCCPAVGLCGVSVCFVCAVVCVGCCGDRAVLPAYKSSTFLRNGWWNGAPKRGYTFCSSAALSSI